MATLTFLHRKRSGETFRRVYAPGRIAMLSLPFRLPFRLLALPFESLFLTGEWVDVGAPPDLASVLRPEYGPQLGPDKLGAENQKIGACPLSATYLIYLGFLTPIPLWRGGGHYVVWN
jgi:hypothetical protein